MMPDLWYVKFIRIYYGIATLNLALVGFNGYRLYAEFGRSTGLTVFLTLLVCINVVGTVFTYHQAKRTQQERKNNMWEILNTPENRIW